MTALRTRTILYFWFPLAVTWLMMSVEGPYVAAIIARMPDAAFNLAAYGVAFAIAWLAESPIMMLMTTANTLARDRQSFLAIRRFMYSLCAMVTVLTAIAVTPPVFDFLATTLMALPPHVSSLAHQATAMLLPWPAAIGYRRFYQGVLVRNRLPRRVAYGTVIRLTSMTAAGATLALTTSLHGATIGSLALATGVVAEAIASRWMARLVIAEILAQPDVAPTAPLTQRAIVRFYYPLALTSMIAMIMGPMLTFFMGRGRFPIESLAVLPVVQALLFVFRSGAVGYQEVGVALSGKDGEHEREIGRVALFLGIAASGTLALVLFTPLASVWWRKVSGLSPELADFALLPARLLVLLPAMEYLLSYQRSRFILTGRTRTITVSTAIEIGGVAIALVLCTAKFGMTGAVAGSVAFMLGRFASNTFLAIARR